MSSAIGIEATKLQPKPNGRNATLERNVEELQNKLDTVVWLHAEMSYGLKVAAVQQLVQALLSGIKGASGVS